MKIAIIADDLTGAAELASASADLGFATEVHTRFDPASAAEVIAIDSNSRGLSPERAAAQVGAIAAEILQARPDWIYKKTDSVLRGNVRAEIEAILVATGSPRATLISANPTKGRIIRRGRYFVNDIALHETVFAHDPDHPRRTSDVLQLLGNGRLAIASVRVHESLPTEGISVPNAETSDHLAARASEMPLDALAAGGVEFFQAVVKVRAGRTPVIARPIPDGATLRVCGSAHAWGQGRAEVCAKAGVPIFAMPEAIYANAEMDPGETPSLGRSDSVSGWVGQAPRLFLRAPSPADFQGEDIHQIVCSKLYDVAGGGAHHDRRGACPTHFGTESFEKWVSDVVAAIASGGQAMIAIGRDPQMEPSTLPPSALVESLAQAVARIICAAKLQRVLLEGGATAAAVLGALNWTKLTALPSARYPGVAALQAPGSNTILLMKPGSYPWPNLSAS